MRTSLLIFSIVALAGCGLTLDAIEPDDAGGGLDAGIAGDAGPARLDGASDGAVYDAGPSPLDGGSDAGCVDSDDDGVTICAGDCDDTDPTVYPGAPMICGDGVDNGCGGGGEETGCRELGTYVSVETGDDMNRGTQEDPVKTIAQGLANAATIGRNVAVYVAAGRYREDITMVDTHSILCGYDDSDWTRDSSESESELMPSNRLGVVFPSGVGRLTELDGCTVRGVHGMTMSAAVTFLRGASGVLSESRVIGGDNPGGSSTAIVVLPLTGLDIVVDNPGRPLIVGNVVEMGRSASGWSLTSTSIGIWSARTEVTIDGNTVSLAEGRSVQRAIELRNSLGGSLVVDNLVRPTGSRSEETYGLRVVGGSVSASRNDIYAGSCDGRCLAVEVTGALNAVSFTNNLFYGGDARSDVSAGLLFTVEGSVAGASLDVLVHSNLIVGGDGGSPSVGVGWWGDGTGGVNRSVGRVMNNIIYAGGRMESYAMWEEGRTLGPLRLEANALFSLTTGGSAALYLEGGARFVTASEINDVAAQMGVRSLVADCQVIDPAPDGDPHLMPSSPCIDVGTSTYGPLDDWDGDPRPRGGGYDIGADETDGT